MPRRNRPHQRQIIAFLMPGDCCDLHISMLAEMDPLAFILFEKYYGISLPNLRLDDNATVAILRFLQDETERQQALGTPVVNSEEHGHRPGPMPPEISLMQ